MTGCYLQACEPNKKVLSVISGNIYKMLGKILTILGLFFRWWHLMLSDQTWIQRKSAKDDRLLSANDVINLIFKMSLQLVKWVYSLVLMKQNMPLWCSFPESVPDMDTQRIHTLCKVPLVSCITWVPLYSNVTFCSFSWWFLTLPENLTVTFPIISWSSSAYCCWSSASSGRVLSSWFVFSFRSNDTTILKRSIAKIVITCSLHIC